VLGLFFVILENLEETCLIASIGILVVALTGLYTTMKEQKRTRTIIYEIISVVVFTVCSAYIIIGLLIIIIWNNIQEYTSHINTPTGYTVILVFFVGVVAVISLLGAAVSSIRLHMAVKGKSKTYFKLISHLDVEFLEILIKYYKPGSTME
jgi:hypothetical protein